MTVTEAIALVDALKPNQIERERKIEWLSRLDQWIFDEVITPREKDENTPDSFTPYGPEYIEGNLTPDPGTRELLIPSPYDETYRFYLEMQIDLANLEMDKCTNSMSLYQNARGQFMRAYNRTHRRLDTNNLYYHF